MTLDEVNSTIWRYMDLPRFVSLVSTRGIWFSKAANLHDDPYEGFSKADWFTAPSDDTSPACIVQETPDGVKTNISVVQIREEWSKRSAAIFDNARDHLYVNSWCMAPVESMAMWQIYGSSGFGVAVKSSVERYKRAMKFKVDDSHYTFGRVNYHGHLESAPAIMRDFRHSIPFPGPGLRREMLPLGLHKRACYAHEQEWRAVIYQDRREIPGLQEECEIDELIETVYVGPRAEEFLFDAVASIMDKFQMRKPLHASRLLKAPQPG